MEIIIVDCQKQSGHEEEHYCDLCDSKEITVCSRIKNRIRLQKWPCH